MARKPSATKNELATIKVMSDSGLTANAIGKRTGRDPKTIRRYLRSGVYQNDPELGKLIEVIKEMEINDLYLLNMKAREHLHMLLDEGNMKPIETIATMDRTFQQRRLLEGQSTDNVAMVMANVAAILELERKKKEGE